MAKNYKKIESKKYLLASRFTTVHSKKGRSSSKAALSPTKKQTLSKLPSLAIVADVKQMVLPAKTDKSKGIRTKISSMDRHRVPPRNHRQMRKTTDKFITCPKKQRWNKFPLLMPQEYHFFFFFYPSFLFLFFIDCQV